jgi:hypothetical protein
MVWLMLMLSLVVIEASFIFWDWYRMGGFSRRYWLMTTMLLSVYVPLISFWLALLICLDSILFYIVTMVSIRYNAASYVLG